jgi:protein tyrosine/serine phosphatase
VDSDPPTDAELKAFFDVVLDPAKRPVFVHCAHGKDRTGTMCAVYRMEVDGWTPEKAFEEMQKFGFHDLYTDLEKYVKAYTPRFAEKVRAFPGPR